MKSKIIELAKKEKISDLGFCSAADYLERAAGFTAEASFFGGKNAKEALNGAKTLIVCAFSYYNGAEKGNISRYAQGIDYHTVARDKMKPIVAMLAEQGYAAEAYADNGALNERLLGTLSGISFVGKNHMAINESLGSYFFIGYVITDCELEPDKENDKSCMGCGMCVKACPLGALANDVFDEQKCLSYITQKKGELSDVEIEVMHRCNTIWGCDVCQEVCPHNKALAITEIEEFNDNLIIDLKINEELSNREFKKQYGNRAFAWRGKNIILRNQNAIYNRKEK